MSGVPVRLRLTAAFALTMAVLLAAVGFFLYQHLASSLDRTIAQGLHARAADVGALVRQTDTGLSESQLRAGAHSGFAQVLDGRGRVFDQTPGLRHVLLTPDEFARASRAPLAIGRTRLLSENVRLLAEPVAAQDRRLVVVVGAPLETRDNALATLRTELIVGGPVALLLASFIAYLLAAAALRPVERLRSGAAAISASRLSERLSVAPAHDEVSRLGETLNEMLGRLETALERERRFVADASHELRTPLAHLQAEIDLALESPRARDELEAALRSAGTETDRLCRLAADLLLLARLDEGTLPIRRDPVEVDELLGGVAARFERRAGDAARTIEIDAPGGRADVDRLRIEQALGNLVDNALRHGAGTIRISAARENGTLELGVTDGGPGFPPEFAPHAFERFSRADQSRSEGGTGLGLAIVAAVASAHGGTAEVRQGADGAGVAIRVPRRTQADLERGSTRSPA